jgi:hypothetical protein
MQFSPVLCWPASTRRYFQIPSRTFAELKARIATAIDFIRSLRPAQINNAGEREVVFTFRNGSKRRFTGQALLLTFSTPQFFFHVTTAYDILRHCGVDLVKKDFLGTPSQSQAD